MPSPFPGMNPYIERDAVWHDFHAGYISAIKKALVPQVRPEFYVKIDEHIYVRTDEESRRLVGLPNVSIARNNFEPESNGAVGLPDSIVTAPDFTSVLPGLKKSLAFQPSRVLPSKSFFQPSEGLLSASFGSGFVSPSGGSANRANVASEKKTKIVNVNRLMGWCSL